MDIKATWPYVWAEVGNIFKVSMINSEAFDLGELCQKNVLYHSMDQITAVLLVEMIQILNSLVLYIIYYI